jgi:broad specificity phosphatase PhoE
MAQDAEGRVMGQTNPSLSPEGVDQVEQLAASWPRPPDRIICSDLRRAKETADRIAARWGLEVATDVRLREMDFGEWDGRFWSEIERDDAERLQAWMENWIAIPAPAGESFTDLAARVERWAAECLDAESQSELVVVAHVGTIRALLSHLLGTPLSNAYLYAVDRARVSTVEVSAEGCRLVAANQPSPA